MDDANALQTQENEPMVDTVIETPVVATPVVVEAPAMVETPAMVVAPVVEELYDDGCGRWW